MILTLEGNGAWLHHGSYATYPQARADAPAKLGDAVARWNEEEKRLRELTRIFKERARYSPDLAKRASAFETRWKRFKEAGPPPPPVSEQQINVRLRGGDSARRVLDLRASRRAGPGQRLSPMRSTSASGSASSGPTAAGRPT